MILRDIHRSSEIGEKVVCIIDDNPNKWNRYIDGVPVVGGRDSILKAAAVCFIGYSGAGRGFCAGAAGDEPWQQSLDESPGGADSALRCSDLPDRRQGGQGLRRRCQVYKTTSKNALFKNQSIKQTACRNVDTAGSLF